MTGTLAALSDTKIAVMVAVIVAVLFLTLLAVSLIRTRRGSVATAIGEGPAPVREEKAGRAKTAPLSRRDFFRRSLVTSLAIFGAQFGGASIAFLWPNLKGGFGSVISAGSANDIKGQIQQTDQPFYYGAGRFYIVTYNGSGVDAGTGTDYEADGTVAEGLVALYQRCVHLGCRVPFCQASQWFECPCHGSKYNKAGEYQLGPAPHGMDRFPITVTGGQVSVDTSTIILGPPRGTDTIKEPPQGPFCVGA